MDESDKNLNETGLIMLLGATGYTGRLIAAELKRLKLPFGLAGRNASKLAALHRELELDESVPLVVADPLEPTSLPALFKQKVAVVLNCVGPFTQLGEPVVRASLEHGAHYLDITGEQGYLARIITNYHLLALSQKRAAIPACGFEYALTNWAAALAAQDLEPLDTLTTATVAQSLQTSRGTQRSVFAVLSSYGLGWRDGHRIRKLTGSEVRSFKFPAPFGRQSAVWAPFGDTVTLPRHLQVRRVDSFLALAAPLAFGLRLVSPALPMISTVLGPLLDKPIGLRSSGPQAEQREANRWVVMAQASGPKGQRTVTVQGRDVYGLTAILTAWCAARLLDPGYAKSGVLGPAQAFDPTAALHYLKEFGVTFI